VRRKEEKDLNLRKITKKPKFWEVSVTSELLGNSTRPSPNLHIFWEVTFLKGHLAFWEVTKKSSTLYIYIFLMKSP
jgi:hypothetical protein